MAHDHLPTYNFAKTPQLGFLAIELLFLLSISAVIALTALPNLAQIRQAGVVRYLTREVRHCFRLAHIRALETGKTKTLAFTPNSLECPSGRSVSTLNVPPGLQMKIHSSSDSTITFSEDGALSPTRINIQNKAHECVLTLALRGATRMFCRKKDVN
jgi:Tfp pilus assembly protein FimT